METPYYQEAFESMFDVLKMFENKKSPAPAIVPVENNKNNENHSNNISRHNGLINLARLLRSKSSEQIEDSFDKAIKDEIRLFTSLINEIEIRSTKRFWLEQKNTLPNLYLLAIKLLNIPPSSSSIGAFF
jgi:hypothetical protein